LRLMVRVIFNPAAGPKAVQKIDRIRDSLARTGAAFEVCRTTYPGEAVHLAREAAYEGMDVVVAVGGDGTINEAVGGLAGSRTRLAVVPHGTGNVLAKEVGLPKSVEGCIDLLREGKTIEVPLARAEDRYFLLLASAGFDAEVIERVTSRQKGYLGIGAYYLAGIRHLLRSHPTLWLEFPGKERIEAQAVILCRGKKYAGGVVMAPRGNLTGNTLHVVALLRPGRWAILRFALKAFRGRLAASPGVLHRETDAVLIRSRIPSAVQVDGDYLAPLPVRFEMTRETVRLVVPRDYPAPEAP
jgi:diacylglycerol kinase (ATP)